MTATVVDEIRSPSWDGPDPAISVLVSTYRRPAFLDGLLAALAAQDVGAEAFEVVVVDNGSGDDTWDRLAEAVPASPLRLLALRLDRNLGPASGRNAGAARVRAPRLAITDDDCLPTPGWLRHVGLALDTGADVVQGAVHPDPAEVASMGPWDHTKRIAGPTPFFETCNVAYRTEAFRAAGGFDEDDPLLHPPSGRAFGEDACLAWEVLRHGGTSAFAPRALVHHRVLPGDYARWLADQRELAGFPGLARRSPLIARWLRHGIFLERRSQLFDLAVVAVAAAVVTRRGVLLVGTLPWLKRRWGAARLLAPDRREAVALLARLAWSDAVGLGAMARGSVRHRRLVL